MSELKTQIVVGADSSGVAAGLEPGKAAIKGFAQSALIAGKEAGGSLEGIGDKAGKGGQKVEAATKSMVGSIQRLTAATEAGDKTSRQYYESIAKLRGVDTSTLKPYLDQLDASKAKALEATKANDSFGASLSNLKTSALAVVAVVGSLALYTKSIIDGVDALNDLKDATGASIENISALEDVARRTGGSFDTVSTAMIKFNGVLNSAQAGSEAEQVLKALGLSAKELKEIDPAEALLKTSLAFAKFSDDGNKARGMQELFGKSTKEVAALLKDLAEKGSLVSTVTTKQAEEAEKFNKELFNMKKNVDDASRSLIGPMVSAINEVIKKFREGRVAGESFFAMASRRYVDGVRDFYGVAPRNTGGANGSWGDPLPPPPKPSLPDISNPPKAAKSGGGGGAEKIDPQIKAYQQLVLSIREKIAANQEEINLGRKLTDSEKQVLEVQKMLAKGSISARDAASEKTKAMLAEFTATENTRIANEANLALEKTLREEKYKTVEAIEKANASGFEQNKTLTDEVALIGLSADQQRALTQARLEGVIAQKEQALASLQSEQFYSREQIALEEEIRLLKEKAALQGQKFDRSAEAEKLSELQKQGAKFATDLESGITASLSKAFSSGKGFFKSLWEDIKNAFKTTALKLIVNAVAGGAGLGGTMASAATNILGGGGTGGAGGTLSNMSSLYSGVSNMVGIGSQVFAGTMSVANALGTVAANVTGTGLSGLLATNGAFGTAAAGSASAAAGTAASGLSSMLAAIPVWGWAALAAITVAAIFGGKGKKETTGGGIEGNFNPDGFTGNNFSTWKQKGGWVSSDKSGTEMSGLDAGVAKQFNDANKAMRQSAIASAEALGLSSDAAKYYSQRISLQLGKDEAANKAAVEKLFKDLGDNIALAVAPGLAQLTKEGESAGTALTRLATSLTGVNATFDMLGKSLLSVSLTGGDSASKLADAFGGLDKLAASSKSFYETFYTEAEKAAQAQKQVTAALAQFGVALPDSKEAFKALVLALDLTTDAGRATYAAMLTLAPEFASSTDAMAEVAKKSMNDLFSNFVDSLNNALTSIANERGAVQDATLQINKPDVMTAEQIRRGIADTALATPGSAAVTAASTDLAAKDYAYKMALSASEASKAIGNAGLSSAQEAFGASVTKYQNLASRYQEGAKPYAISVGNSYGYDSATNQIGGAEAAQDRTQTGRAYRHFIEDTQRFRQAFAAVAAELEGGNSVLADQKATLDRERAAAANLASIGDAAAAAALRAVKAAELKLKTELANYVTSMENFAIDAGKSAAKLGKLREETMKYYEAQKQLADLMTSSASGLRGAVAAARNDQLDPAQSLAQQQGGFNTAYSMALATTGAMQAGYADKLTAALPGLSAALMDTAGTREEWALATGKLFAQSQAIADALEANAPQNYAADSLAMLGEIDAALMVLEASSKSAEAIISEAVKAGSVSTANGLRAVIAAITGQAIPAFATGGMFGGGLRIVGENGPELEATGPSRIFSASQTRGMLSGGNDALIQDLIREVQGLRAEAQATASHTNKTARLLDRAMPDGDAISTRVAV